MPEPTAEHRSTGRIEAFSDGVIAIIVTIMVLELKIPEQAGEAPFWSGLLLPLLPKLLSYALSFLVVAIMWVNHHALMETARVATRPLMWWNNNLLFWMSLIPLATGFLGEHPLLPAAVALYGFVLAASGAGFTLLRRHLASLEQESGDLRELHARVMRKSILGAVLYASSVPLAFVSVYLSIAIFFLVPAMFFLPDRAGDREARVTSRAGGAPAD